MGNKKPIMKTPITYYGGKQKMLSVILPMIPEHSIYVEPFFGGGAVFWAKEPAQVEFINDINGEVANFYRVLQTDYDALKREVDQTLHSELMPSTDRPRGTPLCAAHGLCGRSRINPSTPSSAARGNAACRAA